MYTSAVYHSPKLHIHSQMNVLYLFIYLFGVLRCFQHCTGHITTGSWKGRGNQYIQFVRVLYCKLPTNSKKLPAFPLEVMPGTEPRPQRWEARVLPVCHPGPYERASSWFNMIENPVNSSLIHLFVNCTYIFFLNALMIFILCG